MAQSSRAMSVSSTSESDSEVEIIEAQKDFAELYSPPRVFFAATGRNLKAHISLSFDLANEFDFQTLASRADCLRALDRWQPKFIMLSPPCTMYSPLQALWNLAKMSDEVKEAKWQEAHTHLDFSMMVAEKQVHNDRWFTFEHPHRASSWNRDSVKRVLALKGCYTVTFDQCQTGLKSPEPDSKPIRKRTTLMTNAPAVKRVFQGLQCNCPAGSHATIQGSVDGIQLSTWCQHYTPDLCSRIAEAVELTLQQGGQAVVS